MSEDKHIPPHAPVPEALQDHEPTDRSAARGVWIAILIGMAISFVVFLVIYGRTQSEDHGDQAPVPMQTAPN